MAESEKNEACFRNVADGDRPGWYFWGSGSTIELSGGGPFQSRYEAGLAATFHGLSDEATFPEKYEPLSIDPLCVA